MIDRLFEFTARCLAGDRTGHDLRHARRVLANARLLQAGEGGDLRIIEAAAVLHDCADHKLFADTEAQRKLIRSTLLGYGYSETEADHVDYIIANISYNKGENRPLATREAQIVRDADRLDAIGAVGIVRTIEYGTAKGRPFYDESGSEETTIAHFHEKLLKLKDLMHTATARRIAASRHAFLETFLQEFDDEIAGRS